MHGSALDGGEVRLCLVSSHLADLHPKQLLVRLPDEPAGGLVRGNVVAVLIPHEDSRAFEALGSFPEERELRDPRRVHRLVGRMRLNRAPCGSASS